MQRARGRIDRSVQLFWEDFWEVIAVAVKMGILKMTAIYFTECGGILH